MWCFARYLMKESGSMIYPSVRSCEQHAHMLPAIYHHLKTHDCEKAQDKFGRLNGTFYKNWVRQENGRYSSFTDQMEKHL